MTFNPNTEVALLKAQTKLRTRKRRKPSKLDKYHTHLCKLYEAGASKAHKVFRHGQKLYAVS